MSLLAQKAGLADCYIYNRDLSTLISATVTPLRTIILRIVLSSLLINSLRTLLKLCGRKIREERRYPVYFLRSMEPKRFQTLALVPKFITCITVRLLKTLSVSTTTERARNTIRKHYETLCAFPRTVVHSRFCQDWPVNSKPASLHLYVDDYKASH